MRHLLPPLVISALLLSACGGRDADPLPTPADVNNDVTTDAPAPQDISTSIGFTYDTATTKVAFNPVISEVSLPSFTLFVNSTDGTAKVTIDAASDPNPVTNAINDLDGWSTTAPMNIDFKGALSTSSVCTPYMVATGTSCAPNVFLIPLTTSETGEVLSPTSITGVNSTLLATTQVKAQAVTLETGNDSVRLEPVAPLASETMYLLAITNGLEDTSNQPVGPSAMYQILSDTADQVYAAIGYPAALDSIRAVIQAVEPIALQTINGLNTAMSLPTITQDDIVYTHLFTTTDPTAPLNSLADPTLFNAGLSSLSLALPDNFANARTSGFYSTELVSDAVSALPQAPYFPSTANLVQGAMALPSYLEVPSSTDSLKAQVTTIQAAKWAPSETVAAAIQQSVPADVDVTTTTLNGTETTESYNVTYRYPFAEKQADTAVPVTVVTPTAAKPAAGWPVVVMVHGITGDRSSLLLLASKLADACNTSGLSITPNCFASVMIDLPLHGVNTRSANPVLDSANPLDASLAGALPAALQSVQERHFGITYNPQGTTDATTYLSTDAAPSSGSLFINLSHFQNTRDHLKQAVMDQLNVIASLGDMDVDQNASNGPDFDTDHVYLVGHSLGAMVGLTTAAVANISTRADIPRIQATAILNGGGQLTRLLENSPNTEFGAPVILAGLAASGLNQNTKNYESYFNVFQGIIDSGDPINFAAQLTATGTPSYFMEMTNDQVVPVDADNDPNAPYGNALVAPLAGTEPLIRQASAVSLSSGDYTDGTGIGSAGATDPKTIAVRFNAGTHTTAALPQTTQEAAVFTDMVNHISTFFTLDGQGIEVTNMSSSVQ